MSIELNRCAVDQARGLIADGRFVSDDRLDWRDHHRRSADEDAFIREHGIKAYGDWHLGIDDEEPEGSKAWFHYPYGDFSQVHRCALFAAEEQAEELVLGDIELAAEDLLRKTGA
jgi:hypothetical protein